MSSTSLQVTWGPPLENETHGVIREYKIRYRKVECNSTTYISPTWTEKTVNGPATSYDFVGLTKWSCYDVQVLAFTIGSGAWSEAVRRRTSEDGK